MKSKVFRNDAFKISYGGLILRLTWLESCKMWRNAEKLFPDSNMEGGLAWGVVYSRSSADADYGEKQNKPHTLLLTCLHLGLRSQ